MALTENLRLSGHRDTIVSVRLEDLCRIADAMATMVHDMDNGKTKRLRVELGTIHDVVERWVADEGALGGGCHFQSMSAMRSVRRSVVSVSPEIVAATGGILGSGTAMGDDAVVSSGRRMRRDPNAPERLIEVSSACRNACGGGRGHDGLWQRCDFREVRRWEPPRLRIGGQSASTKQ